MAIPKREDIINTLVTILQGITTLKIVKKVSNIDNKYPTDLTTTQLPAVKLYLTDETPNYLPSKQAMNKISPDLYLYCIEWNKDSIATVEEVLKLVRNKIGEYLTLQYKCVNIDIRTIVNMEVTYPLVMFKVNLNILYDGNISNL